MMTADFVTAGMIEKPRVRRLINFDHFDQYFSARAAPPATMRRSPRRETIGAMVEETRFTSGDPLAVVDDELTIRAWNAGAEALTGVPARDAVGRACWDVVAALDGRGDPVCHARCPRARNALAGRPVPRSDVSIRTRTGRRSVALSTVGVAGPGGRRLVHLLHPAVRAHANAPHTALTARQLQVLQLLAEGMAPKAVAMLLAIRESTARNHIRGILLRLGAHSQLEAVARAARLGLVEL
jgi:DNA-binding CsgD family transcriptional regulator